MTAHWSAKAFAALTVAALAAACAEDPVPTTAPSAPPSPLVAQPPSPSGRPSLSPTADCPAKAQLADALSDDVEVAGWSGGVRCTEDWAAAGVDIVDPSGTIDGEPAINTEVRLFRRDGDRWVAADRSAACESGEVPTRIVRFACHVS